MESRIKLAEAMGWVSQPNEPNGEPVWLSPDGEDPYYLYELPDPYTDANDDYSVLVWMREHHKWQEFKPALGKLREESIYWRNSQFTWMYQIGDYARAALKVIDDE